MIDQFFALFSNNAVHRVALISSICSNVVRTFEQEFANDKTGKNVALDALVNLLQQHKTADNAVVPPPAIPVTEIPVQ